MSHKGWRNLDRSAQAAKTARFRQKLGYQHALAGKTATSVELEYQSGYRRGLERRRDLLLNDLDESA